MFTKCSMKCLEVNFDLLFKGEMLQVDSQYYS
jgi:hypothetical protein